MIFIEAGFITDKKQNDMDVAFFDSIKILKQYLLKDMGVSKIALMVDNVDVSKLENYDGTVVSYPK